MAFISNGAGGAGVLNRFAGFPRLVLSAAVIAVLLLLRPFVIVSAGERGVVLRWGAVQEGILGEGFHWRVPVMDRIEIIDVRVQKAQTDADAASKDLQDTHSTIAVNYHLDPEKVNWIFQTLGTAFKDRIIDPAVQEVVKAITARYTAVELITQRERVRQEIREMLKTRMAGYHIYVDDFAIVNFRFSQQFAQAIEAKQTAEQLALKAQRDLERVKIEAEQKITNAKAEAEALRLQKANVTSELIQLRQIEASIKAIDKWNGILPQVTGSTVPFIDVATHAKAMR